MLAILSNLISADRDVPAFLEAGTLSYSPILKKRQKNVRCIVERFLRPAKNPGQIPQKCPFVIWKENFSAETP